ncbi:hypothetical protein [Peribacillus muralis]|uniref:hypothetical protein n=1 Tax=Peribacillus muralis TaxID=264697 RepID=UPI003D00A6DB
MPAAFFCFILHEHEVGFMIAHLFGGFVPCALHCTAGTPICSWRETVKKHVNITIIMKNLLKFDGKSKLASKSTKLASKVNKFASNAPKW